jgi:hypothetical protein
MIETGIAVGYLVAWAVRKATRVGQKLDAEIDTALDSAVDQLHCLVADKLGTDPALAALREEAAGGSVSDLTRQRVALSIQAACEDRFFAEGLSSLLLQLQNVESAGNAAASGSGAAAVTGDVTIRADGGAAAWQMRDVSIGAPPDPRRPDGSSG